MVIDVQNGTPEPATVQPDVALVVDLDGTLTPADTLHEWLVSLVKNHPVSSLQLPVWLSAGKARLKREVAARAPLDVSVLPYNQLVIDHVRAARAEGQRTVLATASDTAVAEAIAEHLNRHSPDDIQIRGNRTTAPSPRGLCSHCSHPMT